MALPLFGGALLTFNKKGKFLFLLPLLGGIFILPGTGSRSGFLGVVIAFFVFLFLTGRRLFTLRKRGPERFKKRIIIITAVVVVFGIISSILFFSKKTTLFKRFDDNIKVLFSEETKDKILEGRNYFWKAAFLMIKDFPLSGIGPGAFTCELPNYFKKHQIKKLHPFNFYQKKPAFGVFIDTAGNLYLQIASELGLIGLFLFGWIFFLILKKIFSAQFKGKDEPWWIYLTAGVSASIISLLVIFMSGAHILYFENQLFFWMLVGILFVLIPPKEKPVKIKRGKMAALISLIVVFVFSHTYNSFNALSLKSRTKEFQLVQKFGLHKDEKMDGQEFRWTGKSAGITLKVEKTEIIIPILASHPDIQKDPVKLKIILMDGFFQKKRLLENVLLKDNNWHSFKYDLSGELGRSVMLLFEISRTWQPLEVLGTTDTRYLGIGLGNITFEGSPAVAFEKIFSEENLIRRISRSDWQGEMGGNLYRSSDCRVVVDLPAGDFVFRFSARGIQALDEWPYMQILLNGEIIGGEWVSSSIWDPYVFKQKLDGGRYLISVEFINDYFREETLEDRNLYVGDLEIYRMNNNE
jgi:hypothetical protein